MSSTDGLRGPDANLYHDQIANAKLVMVMLAQSPWVTTMSGVFLADEAFSSYTVPHPSSLSSSFTANLAFSQVLITFTIGEDKYTLKTGVTIEQSFSAYMNLHCDCSLQREEYIPTLQF